MTEMKILKLINKHTSKNKFQNDYIRKKVGIIHIKKKMMKN